MKCNHSLGSCISHILQYVHFMDLMKNQTAGDLPDSPAIRPDSAFCFASCIASSAAEIITSVSGFEN